MPFFNLRSATVIAGDVFVDKYGTTLRFRRSLGVCYRGLWAIAISLNSPVQYIEFVTSMCKRRLAVGTSEEDRKASPPIVDSSCFVIGRCASVHPSRMQEFGLNVVLLPGAGVRRTSHKLTCEGLGHAGIVMYSATNYKWMSVLTEYY